MVIIPDIKDKNKKSCPGCYGTGVQENNEGLRVLCPICNGSGKIRDPDYNPCWQSDKLITGNTFQKQ